MRVLPALSIGIASLLLVGFGCSPSSLVDKAVQAGVNSQLGSKGSVNVDNGNVTVHDNGSGTSATYGANVTIPSDFPKEIPILDGATATGVATTDQGSWVSFTSTMKSADVVTWYGTKLTADGWKKTAHYAASGSTTESYTKDTNTMVLVVSDSDNGSTIMVSESSNK